MKADDWRDVRSLRVDPRAESASCWLHAGHTYLSRLDADSGTRTMTSPPSQARVVIVGGGIAGCSTAYHLAKLGIRDVVLLEQGKLTCGTTWHAAGLVGQTRATRNATRMSRYGIELYSSLEAETGLATGWKQCGSLNVARTADRLTLMKRQMARAQSFGVEFEFVSL